MNKQNIPTLLMWERVLRIRQHLQNQESSSSVHPRESVLAMNALSFEHIQEELMKKAMISETLDMPYNPFEDFDDIDAWKKCTQSRKGVKSVFYRSAKPGA
jgi:hypothetical protein